MRRGLTLIEMIFSMVIIAIVFTVVPKIIFVSNKSLQLGIKEDALFNAVTLMGNIVKLPWDQNTILSDGEILNAGGTLCQTDGYRIGGFKGSRNCLNNKATNGMTPDDAKNNFNDIDDYNNESITTSAGRASYTLDSTVVRSDDIKRVTVIVSSSDKKVGAGFQSSFFYDSINLGHIQINKRAW